MSILPFRAHVRTRAVLFHSLWVAWSGILLLAGPVRADIVEMVNGDRVTGTIVGFDEEGVEVETVFMGTVVAEWNAVLSLRSEGPLFVSFDGDQLIEGPVAMVGGVLTVDAPGGEVEMARADIVALRSAERQLAYQSEIESRIDPGIGDLWVAAVDGALSLSQGNADTQSVNIALRTARDTSRDRTSFYLTSLFSSSSTTGERVTTANTVRSGLRYELDVSESLYSFAFSDVEFDRFQDLDLRLVLGGGMGVHLIDRPRNQFEVFAGASSNQEFYEGDITRKTAEAVIGQEWNYRLTDSTTLGERISLYPNVNELGAYRVTFDGSLDTRLNRWFSWQVTVSDRYTSIPRPGKRPNDVLFTTGIRVTLGDGEVGRVGPGSLTLP